MNALSTLSSLLLVIACACGAPSRSSMDHASFEALRLSGSVRSQEESTTIARYGEPNQVTELPMGCHLDVWICGHPGLESFVAIIYASNGHPIGHADVITTACLAE